MGRKRKGIRILGPYPHGNRWRAIEVNPGAPTKKEQRAAIYFETKNEADFYVDEFRKSLLVDDHTTVTALKKYQEYLAEKGNKEGSISRTSWSIKTFFPDEVAMWGLTGRYCQKRYKALVTEPRKKTGKPLAPDSHRNALAETKTFLDWCVRQRFLEKNPARGIEGVGSRNHGKEQLERIKDVRVWYQRAVDLAEGGDEGARAALMALVLGLRASEIVTRRPRDLDHDERPADVVVISRGKTKKSRRRVECPEPLSGFLAEQAEGKDEDAWLFYAPRSKSGRHDRGWVLDQVHRICDLCKLPRVSAHAMRGTLATIGTSFGAAHLIVPMLGHGDVATTQRSYAKPGSVDAGERKSGHLKVVK